MEFNTQQSAGFFATKHHGQHAQQQQQQQQRGSLKTAPVLNNLSKDDYNNIMMANIGSVLPSRNSIAGFMDDPDGMLAVGNTNGIFDGSNISTTGSSMARTMGGVGGGESKSNFNPNFTLQNSFQVQNNSYQNAIFQQQQFQAQQLNQLKQQQQQQQQLHHFNSFQNGVFPQQLQTVTNKPHYTSAMGSPPIVSSMGPPSMGVVPQPSPFQQTSQTNKPQRTSSLEVIPVPSASSMYERADSNSFNMPDPFSASIDDDIFADLQPIPLKRKEPSKTVKTVTPTPITTPSAPVSVVAATATEAPHPAPSLLHQACYLYPTTLAVVSSALGVEKTNVRRRVTTPASPPTDPSSNPKKRQKMQKMQESFSLPLHIAIDRNGSMEVLRALAEIGPDVVAMTDGPDACNAISAFLCKKSQDLEIIQMLVKVNPEAVNGLDRYANTCLHVACAQGASLEIVEFLYATLSHGAIMSQPNFHGQSPLDVAQQISVCPLEVIDFLQEVVSDSLEKFAAHLVNSEDEGDV